MAGYAFSQRVRRVLKSGADAARVRRHEYIGTEHLLLGLIAEREGVASAVLDSLAVDRSALTAQIDGVIGSSSMGSKFVGMILGGNQKDGETEPGMDPTLPFTSRAKDALELSMSAARELHHNYVGVEHLLLGLLREGKGVGAQVLMRAGVTDDAVRAEVLRVLGPSQEPQRDDLEEEVTRTIIGMEREALERWGRGDPSGFLEISAPDVVYFDPFQSRRLNGIDELRTLYESIRGTVSVSSFELIEPRVQCVGDVAVLTFNYVAQGSNEVTSRWNCTEVYRRQARMWRIIQTHWSITEGGVRSA